MRLGKYFVEAAIKDFESLFLRKAKFNIMYKYENVNSPIVRGETLVFPVDLERMKVSTNEDAAFILMVVSHEISHYVNRHTSHVDKSDEESQSIELWADYYSMRAAMSIVNFRRRFKSLLVGKLSGDDMLGLIGAALVKLSKTYYQTSSPRYPSKQLRAQTALAGITSFFVRMDSRVSAQRIANMIRIVYTNAGLGAHIAYSESDDEVVSLIRRIRSVHLLIQGENQEITAGIQPLYEKYLGSGFV